MAEVLDRLNAALEGRYRIQRELGQGGMATVYLAHDAKHDRDVALKVLHPELGAVIGAERFLQEIKTTARLQHPHILGLIDSGEADGLLYYVMPYVSGESLRSRLAREKQLPIPVALSIAFEVASALDYAHRQGVVHRDIKPENVLLHDGQALVADFGIALAVTAAGGGRMTQTGMSLGTPHYMSPEQALGEREITPRADIYALGAMTYEMLTGDPPFTGSTAQAVLAKIMTEKPLPPSTTRETVAPHVEAAVLVALAKLPADRWESARQFADALGNPGLTAAMAVPVLKEAGGAQRWKTAAIGLGGVALVLSVVAAWGWKRAEAPPPITRLSIVLPDSQPLSLERTASRVALSHDGRKIAFLSDFGRGRRQLFLRRLDELKVEPIPGTEGAINPAFSPDGSKLAFVSGSPRALKVVSLSGGGPPQVLTDSLVDNGGVSWGFDGYIYYDGHLEGDGVARIRETGGKPEIATTPADPSESWHSGPSALPKGRGLFFQIARTRGTSGFDIAVYDAKTRRHRVLFRGASPRYVASGHLLYLTEDGALMAVRFDLDRLQAAGEPVAVASGISIWGLGRADMEVADDGTLVYVAGAPLSRERELIWVSRDGVAQSVDSTWRLPRSAMLSPDGKAVVMSIQPTSSRFEIWIKRLGGAAEKFADLGIAPAWSPDGREIAFYKNGGVFVGPSDGSVTPQLRYPLTATASSLEYTPDGSWLLVTMLSDILGIRTRGDSAPVALLAGPALERRGTVSPDGKWIAYESDESGTNEIYVRPFPNVQTAKRQISVDGGALPLWSHDGRELYYMNSNWDLIAVPVTLLPTFSQGVPHKLFSAAAFASPQLRFGLSPDDRRFLLTRTKIGVTDTPGELIVVQHFADELKARLAK